MAIKLLKPHTHRGRAYPASTPDRAVILRDLRPDQEAWLVARGVGEPVSESSAKGADEPTGDKRAASKRA
tara:strand:- start:1262 stop:1471 length:210 start_codon:yes stop_codon:yes gene_type:complete